MDERNLPQIGCREPHIRRGTAKVSISRNLKICSAPNRLAVFLKSPGCPFCGRCINTFQTISPKHRAAMSTLTRGQIGGNGWMPVTRRALTFTGEEDFGAYRQARLHERDAASEDCGADLAGLCPRRIRRFGFPCHEGRRNFCRRSFRESDQIGVGLMRAAFHPSNGPLSDRSFDEGERDARMNLFVGAIGSYKNPQSHRDVNLDSPREAIEIIMLANHLRIVDMYRINNNS